MRYFLSSLAQLLLIFHVFNSLENLGLRPGLMLAIEVDPCQIDQAFLRLDVDHWGARELSLGVLFNVPDLPEIVLSAVAILYIDSLLEAFFGCGSPSTPISV